MIRNNDKRIKVGVASAVDHMKEVRLRWFEHAKWRSTDASMRCER